MQPCRQRALDVPELAAGVNSSAQRRQPAHGYFLRAVHRDLLRAVRERRIFEPAQQLIAVREYVVVRGGCERRAQILGHQPARKRSDQRIAHRIGHGLQIAQLAEVSDRGVRTVQ